MPRSPVSSPPERGMIRRLKSASGLRLHVVGVNDDIRGLRHAAVREGDRSAGRFFCLNPRAPRELEVLATPVSSSSAAVTVRPLHLKATGAHIWLLLTQMAEHCESGTILAFLPPYNSSEGLTL